MGFESTTEILSYTYPVLIRPPSQNIGVLTHSVTRVRCYSRKTSTPTPSPLLNVLLL